MAGELGVQSQPWLHKQVHGQSGPLGSRLTNKTKTKKQRSKSKNNINKKEKEVKHSSNDLWTSGSE